VKPRDIALTVGVTALWGVNFVVIRVGLDHFPPLLFNALRFSFAAVPAIFFVGRPRVPWRWVFAVAMALGVTKFSLLFAGMAAGMPAGLSSLVLQSQAIFTVLLAVPLLRERPGRRRLAGLAVAAVGVVIVAAGLGSDLPGGAFALVIAAAAAWGLSNVATRKAGSTDMLRFMVWVSALAAPWLIALSLLVDGPATDLAALRDVNAAAIFAVLFVAGAATLGGFAAWGHLISRYGASTVAPFAMLVPLFGIASAALFLDEPVHPTDILGGLLVVGGVLAGLDRARPRQPVGAPDEARTTADGRPAAVCAELYGLPTPNGHSKTDDLLESH
jgi:O-acetylserine/cysteine efflux transporter